MVKGKRELHHQVLPLTESILYKISVLKILLSISLITTHPQPLIKGLKVKPLISVLKAKHGRKMLKGPIVLGRGLEAMTHKTAPGNLVSCKH